MYFNYGPTPGAPTGPINGGGTPPEEKPWVGSFEPWQRGPVGGHRFPQERKPDGARISLPDFTRGSTPIGRFPNTGPVNPAPKDGTTISLPDFLRGSTPVPGGPTSGPPGGPAPYLPNPKKQPVQRRPLPAPLSATNTTLQNRPSPYNFWQNYTAGSLPVFNLSQYMRGQ